MQRDPWRDKALAYERSFAGLCAHPVPVLLDALHVGADTRLLDVGCGTGSLTRAAADRGAVVTAVDAEPSMVEATAARVQRARTCVAALPRLPVADSSFDAVAANFVVNHVARPVAAVAELRRVARPAGRVGVTVWPQPHPPLQRLWDDVVDAAEVQRPAMPRLPPEDDFARTAEGLQDLLERGGLRDIEVRDVSWVHTVDAERWWGGATSGLAGIGCIVRQQDDATVARMKAAYDRLAQPHLDGAGRLALATSALLGYGTRGPDEAAADRMAAAP